MKKIILIVISVLIIGGGYMYFLNKEIHTTPQSKVIDTVSVEQTKNTKEVRVGDMVMDAPQELEIIKSNRFALTFKVSGVYAENTETDSKIQKQGNYLSFSFYENANLEKKSSEEWFATESSKEANIVIDQPDDEFSVKVANLDAYKTIHNSSSDFVDTGYYSREQIYVTNKTDIYEIIYYTKRNPEYAKLTPEEQSSIQTYEKVADQIIQSIRFVE